MGGYLRLGALWVFVAFALVAGTQGTRGAAASAQDPETTVRAFVAALNNHDVQAATALLSDNAYALDGGGNGVRSTATVGKAAFAFHLGPQVADPNYALAIRSAVAKGDTVTGAIEGRGGVVTAAQVDRYINEFNVTVTNGAIASIAYTFDLSDPQTLTFVKFLGSAPPTGAPGGTLLTLPVGSGADGSQPGSAYFGALADGVSFVAVDIRPGPVGVGQQSYLHMGPCGAPGEVAYRLADVVDGKAFTMISATNDEVLAQAKSVDVNQVSRPDRINACGDVLAATAAPKPPAVTPPPGAAGTIIAPSTGTGPSRKSDPLRLPWVAIAVGLVGTLCVVRGSLASRGRR